MNSGDDSDFEQQLRGMELRRPPAEWKAVLLPKSLPPLLPKPLLLGVAACWATSAVLWIATPDCEDLGPPIIPPSGVPAAPDNVLAYQPNTER